MIHIHSNSSQSTLSDVEHIDVQPNAIDLRIDKVLRINVGMAGLFEVSENSKSHRGSELIDPDDNGWWFLYPGDYEVVMKNIIHVGPEEAGWVITRSTLNRNGVYLTSGLYDSGYHGVMAACMHVTCGPMRIQRGTRIGQFVLFKAEALHAYNGSYGLNSQHDAKYTS